jgi:hypothetical protein
MPEDQPAAEQPLPSGFKAPKGFNCKQTQTGIECWHVGR